MLQYRWSNNDLQYLVPRDGCCCLGSALSVPVSTPGVAVFSRCRVPSVWRPAGEPQKEQTPKDKASRTHT